MLILSNGLSGSGSRRLLVTWTFSLLHMVGAAQSQRDTSFWTQLIGLRADPRPWLGQGILFLRLLDLDPRELSSLPHGLDCYIQSHQLANIRFSTLWSGKRRKLVCRERRFKATQRKKETGQSEGKIQASLKSCFLLSPRFSWFPRDAPVHVNNFLFMCQYHVPNPSEEAQLIHKVTQFLSLQAQVPSITLHTHSSRRVLGYESHAMSVLVTMRLSKSGYDRALVGQSLVSSL